MHKDGLLTVASERTDNRPAKFVYTVTEKGKDAFSAMLRELLDFKYEPTFSSDAVFFFSHHLATSEIVERLAAYAEDLKKTSDYICTHKAETLQFVPVNMHASVEILFDHHERHYRAELDWAESAAAALQNQGGLDHGKSESH